METSGVVHLCAAIANIADLARDLPPGELSTLLVDYKDLMIELIEAEQGFYDAAMGDQLTGHWGGIPAQTTNQAALHACRAAVKQVNAAAADAKLARLKASIIIGIACGQEASLSLVKLCRQGGASILVDAPTRELCAEALRFEEQEGLEGKKVYRLR